MTTASDLMVKGVHGDLDEISLYVVVDNCSVISVHTSATEAHYALSVLSKSKIESRIRSGRALDTGFDGELRRLRVLEILTQVRAVGGFRLTSMYGRKW